MKIENWMLVGSFENPYSAPELAKPYIVGEVYDKPGFVDGTVVRTSQITLVDSLNETVVTKSGSVYKIGQPDDHYAQRFPDARARMFGAISELCVS